jgi:hypothetical protein
MANPKPAGVPAWVKGSLWAAGGLAIIAAIAMVLGHNVLQHMGMHMGASG